MEKVSKIDLSKIKPSDIKISYNGSPTLDYDQLENVLTDSEKRTLDALKLLWERDGKLDCKDCDYENRYTGDDVLGVMTDDIKCSPSEIEDIVEKLSRIKVERKKPYIRGNLVMADFVIITHSDGTINKYFRMFCAPVWNRMVDNDT